MAKISFCQSISNIDKYLSLNDFNYSKKFSSFYSSTINNPKYNSFGIKYSSIADSNFFLQQKKIFGLNYLSTVAYIDTISQDNKIDNPSFINLYVGFEKNKWKRRNAKNYTQFKIGYFHAINTGHKSVVGQSRCINAEFYLLRRTKRFDFNINPYYNRFGKYLLLNEGGFKDMFQSDTSLKRRFNYGFSFINLQMGVSYKIFLNENFEINIGTDLRLVVPGYELIQNLIYHIGFLESNKFSLLYSISTGGFDNYWQQGTQLLVPIEQRLISSFNLLKNFGICLEARAQYPYGGFLPSQWNYYELSGGLSYKF